MAKTLKILIPIVLVVALIIVLSTSLVVTQPNEYTIIRQFGAVVRVIDQPGLSLKMPFVQTASTLPQTEMLYDLAVSDVITADKKSMVADSFVLWEISDPLKFIQTLSGNLANAEYRIDTVVYNSLKNVISSMKQEEVISGRDGELVNAIMNNLGDSFEKYGIHIIAVETKKIDLPDDNKSAVYTRMISERNNIAASYLAEGEAKAKEIRNEADKKVTIQLAEANAKGEILKAEGDAEYMRILSEVYDSEDEAEFYSFMIGLDAMEASMTGEEKTIVLDPSSPIAQLFN